MPSANAAFDYNRMERAYTPAAPKVAQPPELHVVESRRARSRAAYRRAGAVFVLVMGIVAAMLYNRMVLTELTAQVEQVQTEYDALLNENRRMQVELEGKTSLRSIQEAAEQLGMSRAENDQIDYVDLGDNSRVTVSGEAPGALESAGLFVRGAFDRVLEYLGW